MKIIKKILKSLVFTIALAVALIWLTGNSHMFTGIRQTYMRGITSPDIDDMRFQSLRTIPADSPKVWRESKQKNKFEESEEFKAANQLYQTEAYLVIHKDSILYEKYYNESNELSYFNSFSMAKSYLAAAIGVAIDEGKIKGLDQKVIDFLPELEGEFREELTIRNLLQMSSGIDFGESYKSPIGYQAKSYYGDQLAERTLDYRVDSKPNKTWRYEGGNSILLGLILEKATGQKISTYLGKKIWSPIGAKRVAYWKLDSEDGLEVTSSAIYSNVRDFARIGKLYMNKGVFEGRRVLSSEFIEESIQPVNIEIENGELAEHYGLHWWLNTYRDEKSIFLCQGMRGQYVVCIPEDDLIVVRIGHNRSDERVNKSPAELVKWIDQAYEFIKSK